MNRSMLAQFMESEKLERNEFNNRWNLSFTYFENKDTLFIRSDVGCWKIIWNEVLGGFILYHMNHLGRNLDTVTIYDLLYGRYHRQTEVAPGRKMKPLLSYIARHDEMQSVNKLEYKRAKKQNKKRRDIGFRFKGRAKTGHTYMMAMRKLLDRESWRMLQDATYVACY